MDELTRAHFADLMADLKASVESVQRAQQEHALITATATAAGKRVTVVVNAEGVVIQTKFSADIADLTYAEIATAITKAAQDAAAQVQRRTRAMITELKKDHARLPKLSEFLPGLTDLEDLVPPPPEISTAPPSTRAAAPENRDGEMKFTDVVQLDRDAQPGSGAGVAESGW